MTTEMNTPADLVAHLETVRGGSRSLDWIIHVIVLGQPQLTRADWHVNFHQDKRDTMVRWYSESDGKWLDQHLPFYTTSIDDAIPDEDIVLSQRTENGRWAALHSMGPDAGSIEGTGHTEALARRTAALKART